MALELYFSDDIARANATITVAMLSAAVAHGMTNVEYVRGLLDVARAWSAAYGIPWSGMLEDIKALLQANGLDALDLPGLVEG